jgi:tetratricopeptide (TPR) repeat protein
LTAVNIGDRETDAALRLAEINFANRRPTAALSFARRQISRRPYTNAAPYRIAVRSAIALDDFATAKRFASALELADPDDMNWVIEKATIKRHEAGPTVSSSFILSSDLDLADPANESLLRGLVYDLGALGRATEGLTYVDAAIDREPNRATLYDLRARMFFELDRFEETSAAVDRCLALDSNYAPALEVRALLALERGDSKGALAALDDATKAAPESADYSYTASAIARKMGDDDLAIAYLEEALTRQPGFALAANDLAWLLADTGRDLDRALTLARVALTRSGAATALDTLGWVRHQRGEYDYAVSSFRSALERYPNSPAIEYRLGMSLLALGETAEARRVFEKLLESPALEERDLARAELARLDDS